MIPRRTPKHRRRRGEGFSRGVVFRIVLSLMCASGLGTTGSVHAQEGQNVEVNSRPVSVYLTNPATDTRTITTRPVSVSIINPATDTQVNRVVNTRPVSVAIIVPQEETLVSRGVSVMLGTPRYGDLDFNNEVDVSDAVISLKITVKSLQATVMQKAVGDVDFSGEIDVSDAIKILRVTVELDPPFPDFPK